MGFYTIPLIVVEVEPVACMAIGKGEHYFSLSSNSFCQLSGATMSQASPWGNAHWISTFLALAHLCSASRTLGRLLYKCPNLSITASQPQYAARIRSILIAVSFSIPIVGVPECADVFVDLFDDGIELCA